MPNENDPLPRLQRYESIKEVSRIAAQEVINEANNQSKSIPDYFTYMGESDVLPIHKVQYSLCVLANIIPHQFFMKKDGEILILTIESVDRSEESRNLVERVVQNYKKEILTKAQQCLNSMTL